LNALTHTDVPLRVQLRFLEYALPTVGDDDNCWLWPLSVGSHGYGQIGWTSVADGHGMVLTHRLSYLLFVGEIPADMTVDHRCRVQRCWNPAHLRLLTNEENGRDNRQANRGPGRVSYKCSNRDCDNGLIYFGTDEHGGAEPCTECDAGRALIIEAVV
jgi:HNH endonuclease